MPGYVAFNNKLNIVKFNHDAEKSGSVMSSLLPPVLGLRRRMKLRQIRFENPSKIPIKDIAMQVLRCVIVGYFIVRKRTCDRLQCQLKSTDISGIL